MPEQKVSYAQNGEDVRIWRALQHVEQPFYVEVGASHPYDDSVTAALSALGWRGVLLEPDTELVGLLREARPHDTVVAAAAYGRAGVVAFDVGDRRGLGAVSASGTVTVPAVRVSDVLADLAPPAVHVMIVDVEGAELEALRGVELKRWRPWVLCVEATAPNSRELVHDEWESLVLQAGYRYVAFDGLNRWYVPDEHAELALALQQPFNVLDQMLDGWKRRTEVQLEQQALEARQEAKAVAAQARHEAEVAVAQAQHETEVALAQAQHETEVALAQARHEAEAAAAQARHEADAAAARARDEVEQLRSELAHMTAQRDQALEREAVMLRSKSWRVTGPLRTARWQAGLALAARRPAPPASEPPRQALPGDDRRWAALRQRVEAARRSGA